MYNKLCVYTDSSKSPFSNVCGIAFIIVYKKEIIDKKGRKIITKSNNRGELQAIIDSIKYIQNNYKCKKIEIYSDSKWSVNCINKIWKARVHLDLFVEFDLLKEIVNFDIYVKWIKGHNGNKFNQEADNLANQFRLKNS